MKAQVEAIRRGKPPKIGRYVYRAALARQFEKYPKTGMKLTPTKTPYWGGDLGAQSFGKVFFATTQKGAEYYGNILKRDAARKGEFMGAIRIPVSSALKKQLQHDPATSGDLFTTKAVSLKGAEVWSGHRWVKLNKDLCLDISTGEWDDDDLDDEDW